VGTPLETCTAINESRLRRRQQKSSDNDQVQTEDSSIERQQNGSDHRVDTTKDFVTAAGKLNEVEEEEPYQPELLQNLIFRYEEPSMHSRWDRPLFTVPWADEQIAADDIFTALTGIPLSRQSPPSTKSIGLETLLQSTISSLQSGEQATQSDTTSIAPSVFTINSKGIIPTPGGVVAARSRASPHQATVQPMPTDSSALYGLEKKTAAIISAIRTFTNNNPSAEAAMARSRTEGQTQAQHRPPSSIQNGITISVLPESSTQIFIPAHLAVGGTTDELAGVGGILALPRLQRLRRQWIGLNRAYVSHNRGGKQTSLSVEQVGDAFVRFLNAQLGGVHEDNDLEY
jgi:protein KTI12